MDQSGGTIDQIVVWGQEFPSECFRLIMQFTAPLERIKLMNQLALAAKGWRVHAFASVEALSYISRSMHYLALNNSPIQQLQWTRLLSNSCKLSNLVSFTMEQEDRAVPQLVGEILAAAPRLRSLHMTLYENKFLRSTDFYTALGQNSTLTSLKLTYQGTEYDHVPEVTLPSSLTTLAFHVGKLELPGAILAQCASQVPNLTSLTITSWPWYGMSEFPDLLRESILRLKKLEELDLQHGFRELSDRVAVAKAPPVLEWLSQRLTCAHPNNIRIGGLNRNFFFGPSVREAEAQLFRGLGISPTPELLTVLIRSLGKDDTWAHILRLASEYRFLDQMDFPLPLRYNFFLTALDTNTTACARVFGEFLLPYANRWAQKLGLYSGTIVARLLSTDKGDCAFAFNSFNDTATWFLQQHQYPLNVNYAGYKEKTPLFFSLLLAPTQGPLEALIARAKDTNQVINWRLENTTFRFSPGAKHAQFVARQDLAYFFEQPVKYILKWPQNSIVPLAKLLVENRDYPGLATEQIALDLANFALSDDLMKVLVKLVPDDKILDFMAKLLTNRRYDMSHSIFLSRHVPEGDQTLVDPVSGNTILHVNPWPHGEQPIHVWAKTLSAPKFWQACKMNKITTEDLVAQDSNGLTVFDLVRRNTDVGLVAAHREVVATQTKAHHQPKGLFRDAPNWIDVLTLAASLLSDPDK